MSGYTDESLEREPMYTAGFTVTLRLPERIAPEQARQELLTCVSFGSPEVSAPWVLPDPDERATLACKASELPEGIPT
jgi:hypothetical protein